MNTDSVIAFPVQPPTPSDSTPEVIPPEFKSPNPALFTANVDSSCPTIKSENLEEFNKGGLKSKVDFYIAKKGGNLIAFPFCKISWLID